MTDKWMEWLDNFQKDLKVGMFLAFLLFACRLVLLGIFGNQMDAATGWGQIAIALIRGLQFDIKWTIILILPLIIFSLIFLVLPFKQLLNRLRVIYASICLSFTLLFGMINIAFFQEYHEQLNHRIFGLWHDDLAAIVTTIWEMFPVIQLSLAFLLIDVIGIFFLQWWLQGPLLKKETVHLIRWNHWKRVLVGCLSFLILFLGVRGRLSGRPLQESDAYLTSDSFLNRIIFNPYSAIYHTVKSYQKVQSALGLSVYLSDEDIEAALQRIFPHKLHSGSRSIDDWLYQEVSLDKESLIPKHIFLIVMESQDSWPLLHPYAGFGLNPQIMQLAQKGIWVPAFLSAGDGTIASLATLMTGMPEVGVYTHYQLSSQTPLPTAIAMQFKKLGYHPNLWYGGYLSWERLGEFALNQGFETVYGGAHMGGGLRNSWGVHDEQLFDYILATLNPNVSSFNLIVTTSNHPNYEVDLGKVKCPIQSIPLDLRKHCDGSLSLKILGHVWYADHCVGCFVEEAEKKFSPGLFVLTGDHWSRRFPNSKPHLYERKSVPLIIYGPEVIKKIKVPQKMAGSHLDIAPTLIELIAPKGTPYVSLGRNLFDENKPQIGFGAKAFITSDAIGEVFEKKVVEYLPWVSSHGEINQTHLEQQYRDIHGIGWWRIMKGTHY